MSDHRKYHGMYFILGFLIAVVAVMMLNGCDRGKTDKGRDCWGMAGMTYQGEQCEPIDYPPPWDEPPIACCMALTPSCMAQCEGIPEDEWLEDTCGVNAISAEYYGWNGELNEPIWLCQAAGIPNWAAP